jgi:pyrroloquinoline quinone biosynthesis protein B
VRTSSSADVGAGAPASAGALTAGLIVLGAAAGGGYPQWNCRCGVCRLAWDGDARVTPRTQSSLAVTGDGTSYTLLNASPDLGQQIRATRALWPREGTRDSPIGAVVLTNGDIDHIAGLLTLRERQPFRLVALAPVHAVLAADPMFRVLDDAVVERVVAKPGETIETTPGVRIALAPVPGKVPLYREGAEPEIGVETGETAGVFGLAGTIRLAYVPGCAAFTDALMGRLSQADVVLFDGTLFEDDEMIRAEVGTKTGRRMGHLPIAGRGGSLDVLQQLDVSRTIYVHLNNTNPVLIEGSPERRAVEDAGIEIAHDGMEIAP